MALTLYRTFGTIPLRRSPLPLPGASMPRITPLDPATATGAAAQHLATTKKMFGSTPNLFTMAAIAPSALEAVNALFAATGKSSLGPQRGELIAIAVSQSNRCGYCVSAHTAIGALHGLDPASLAAAKRGASTDPKSAALMRLAISIDEARGHIPDTALADAKAAGISEAEAIEVVSHVGLTVL